VRYAEVIGDPIGQSKSPLIQSYWLSRLKIPCEYRRTRVARADLADFLAGRRKDPDWLGCNVTMPLKEMAVSLVDRIDGRARAIGAINCIVPRSGLLEGTNTDVDGIAAALDGTPLEGCKVAIVGAGGAARAAVAYLVSRNVAKIAIIVRDPAKAETLRSIDPRADIVIGALSAPDAPLEGSAAIVNASPLGMAGCAEMPDALLESVARHSAEKTLLEMVYHPVETPFLAVGRAAGARTVDGLTMLIGQAARAFELFFGQPPSPPDGQLRALLAMESSD
jgi:shikimate dehydrogenase